MRTAVQKLREENKRLKSTIEILHLDMSEIADRHVAAADRALSFQDALEPLYVKWRKDHPRRNDPSLDRLIAWVLVRR